MPKSRMSNVELPGEGHRAIVEFVDGHRVLVAASHAAKREVAADEVVRRSVGPLHRLQLTGDVRVSPGIDSPPQLAVLEAVARLEVLHRETRDARSVIRRRRRVRRRCRARANHRALRPRCGSGARSTALRSTHETGSRGSGNGPLASTSLASSDTGQGRGVPSRRGWRRTANSTEKKSLWIMIGVPSVRWCTMSVRTRWTVATAGMIAAATGSDRPMPSSRFNGWQPTTTTFGTCPPRPASRPSTTAGLIE